MATSTELMRAHIVKRLQEDKDAGLAAKKRKAKRKAAASKAPRGSDTDMMERFGGSGGPEPAPKDDEDDAVPKE